ncbi:MAG: hypothetical protein IJ299_05075 [Oscillospiraceae bacterium]|nr:hypothetical protein [Oscillospiraceae bacterium]
MKNNNFNYDYARITDADVVKRVKSAVKIDIEKKKAMNAPVAVFDAKDGKVYAEYSDGRRILMGNRIKRGNYGDHVND